MHALLCAWAEQALCLISCALHVHPWCAAPDLSCARPTLCLLRLLQIPYRCVEVNPLTKAELKWSEYKKVPVILIDGQQAS